MFDVLQVFFSRISFNYDGGNFAYRFWVGWVIAYTALVIKI